MSLKYNKEELVKQIQFIVNRDKRSREQKEKDIICGKDFIDNKELMNKILNDIMYSNLRKLFSEYVIHNIR